MGINDLGPCHHPYVLMGAGIGLQKIWNRYRTDRFKYWNWSKTDLSCIWTSPLI